MNCQQIEREARGEHVGKSKGRRRTIGRNQDCHCGQKDDLGEVCARVQALLLWFQASLPKRSSLECHHLEDSSRATADQTREQAGEDNRRYMTNFVL